ncbi:MAG TPA: ornithine cyclodeaminase family protein [Gemmatimonadales bacterium]|nr:ornithine cyclodeaminase family protein [Gemmatimonadales bacterium]
MLTRQDVAALLDLPACIAAVERAFRLHGEGRTAGPGVLGVPVTGGGFHIKAGVLELARPYFAAKTNANFPDNPERHGLPTIQGVIVLADATRGTPLAVMDSMEITTLRTAAATAVAARHLARRDAQIATIAGCGTQGRMQLRAIRTVCAVSRVYAYDRDRVVAERFARELAAELGIAVERTPDLPAAARASDVIVTCTPAREPILGPDDVRPGTFVAAVGADHPEKHEIAPALLAASRVVVDVLEQAATFGDLHHALAAGALTRADVHAELGAVVAGSKPGRRRAEETFVFDSTGMALQDVAAAAAVYERAIAAGRGLAVLLGA